MGLFFLYLKYKKRTIAVLLCFCLIFGVTFALYRIPWQVVLYPSVLCILTGSVFMISDFLRVRKKHRILAELLSRTHDMIEDLPTPDSLQEEDCQKLVFAVKRETDDLEAASSARYENMTEYYTVWAHQIKTPIASMRLSLQNEDSALSRRMRSDLFRIEQYVDMVLAFIRLDSDSTDYVFRKYNIDDLIRQTVKKFSCEFIDRRIGLEYSQVNKTVVTDEKWMSFVLEQVLSNALKYTREGSISIYLSEPDILCIEDTGIGISPEDLPRIFENGYTGYNGRIDKKASGIGLYLCRRIIKKLGFQIDVESRVGKGTLVKIYLGQYELRRE